MMATTKAMSDEELRQFAKQGIERMEKKGIIKGGPLPKAPSELGPPTPGAHEALGVGYQLAKNKRRRARRAKIAAMRVEVT